MPSPTASSARHAEVRRVLAGVLLANLVVVAIKFFVGYRTHSLSVVGDAIHSSVDAVNNLFALVVVRVAAKGPDAEHPYGHAKFETLGALLIVVLLSVSIFELLQGAGMRLVRGAAPPAVSLTAALLLVVTLGANLLIVSFESRAGRRLKSEMLLADAVHTRVDVMVTVAVLAGFGLSWLGLPWADPILAMLVAVLVARAGYEIVRRAIPALVDERAFDPFIIQREAEQISGVVAAYAIRSRSAAAARFAELTIAVDRQADVESAHHIADAVEGRLRDRLDLEQVLVHVEPC